MPSLEIKYNIDKSIYNGEKWLFSKGIMWEVK